MAQPYAAACKTILADALPTLKSRPVAALMRTALLMCRRRITASRAKASARVTLQLRDKATERFASLLR